MNVNRLLKPALLAAACVSLMCACGSNTPIRDTQQQTEQNSQPQTEATETQPAEGTEELVLADLYEQTELDRIYKLNNVDTDGYGVGEAHLKNGYMLLLMHDYSETGFQMEIGVEHLLPSGKLVIFPLVRPDEIVSKEMDQLMGQYQLLTEGRVLKLDNDGGYTYYDAKLEQVLEGYINCLAVLGATDQGDIWVVTDASELALYRDGKPVLTVPVEGTCGGNLMGVRGEKAYFSLYDEAYESFWASVDLADGSVERQDFLYQSHVESGECIYYGSTDKWYMADMGDPLTVTVFDKAYSDEYMWNLDDNYLVAQNAYIDEDDRYRSNLRVYDRANGGLCTEQHSMELAGEELLLYDYDQGIVVFADSTPEIATRNLYLWDLNGLEAEQPAAHYETVDYHMDQARIDSMVEKIYDQYGIEVFYKQADLDQFDGDFALAEMEDKSRLGYALHRLMECMEEYPEGFFQELKSKDFTKLEYYISGIHERLVPDTVASAAGTASVKDDVLRMTLDANYWWDFRRTFLHENMHLMDAVLEIETERLFPVNIYSHWYNEVNSPKIASMQHYNYEETEENLRGIYQFGQDPEEAWYIDSYSKSTMSEDRARILENSIYSASDCYFESSHINRKARCLNAEIRAVFDCVKNSNEPVLWEARTGIVDIKEEFPELVND